LETASNQMIEILMNHEIIAINQDPVIGTGFTPFRWGINVSMAFHPIKLLTYLLKSSSQTTLAMIHCEINTLDKPVMMFFNLTESLWIQAGIQYSYPDLWAHSNNGTAVRNFAAYNVPPHGIVALLLQDTGDEPEGLWPPCIVTEWCISQSCIRIN
ncbi:glycoside hydrolase family 27 protein, partial [Pisolithus tinctorius Marx 270]